MFPHLSRPFSSTTLVQGQCEVINPRQILIRTGAGPIIAEINGASFCKSLRSISREGMRYDDKSLHELDQSTALAGLAVYHHAASSKPKNPTAFKLTSFGANGTQLITKPDFHYQAAAWVADFWLPFLDIGKGGIFTNILNGGVRDPGPERDEKWSYITSRAVAGFSFAFQLTGEIKYIEAAEHCLRFLQQSSTEVHGQSPFFRTRQTIDGSNHLSSAQYLNIFVQEYSLTGPLRFYAASGDRSTETFIKQMCDSLMKFHDSTHGGFYDGLNPQTLKPVPGLTDTKSFTSSADLIAAVILFAAENALATDKFKPNKILAELCRIIIDKHIVPGSPFIIESLNRDWSDNSSLWRNEYATPDIAGNIGATAKVARVLAGSLHIFGAEDRERALAKVKDILDGLLSVGAYDYVRGAVFDVMDRQSKNGDQAEFTFHGDYVWWVQQQLCQASYLGYIYFQEPKYLEVARSIQRFWIGAFMAPAGGVHDTVDHAGNPVSTHMGRYVKSLYHELEFPYFIGIFEAIINQQPLSLFFTANYQGDFRRALPRLFSIDWQILSVEKQENGIQKVSFFPQREK